MEIGSFTIELKRMNAGLRQFSLSIVSKGRSGAFLFMPPKGYSKKWFTWLDFGGALNPAKYTFGSLYFGSRFLSFSFNKPKR